MAILQMFGGADCMLLFSFVYNRELYICDVILIDCLSEDCPISRLKYQQL